MSSQTFRSGGILTSCSLCGAVVAQYEGSSTKPTEILVDSIGLGAGVVDRLRELGLPVLGVNVSESPAVGSYRNLRAELWYRCKDWLAKRDCKLPKNDDLISELCSVRYTFSSNGKAQVESKDEMRKRGLRSPDLGRLSDADFRSKRSPDD